MADDARVTELLEQIAKQGEEWKNGVPGAREALITSAIQIRPALSTPTENMLYLTWTGQSLESTLRAAQEISLCEALAATDDKPQSSAEVADKCQPQVDATLAARLLRNMAAAGFVGETDADRFVSTSFSRALCREAFKDTVSFMVDYFHQVGPALAPYLAQNNYKAPTTVTHTPWHTAFKAPPIPIWAYWAAELPLVGKQFGNVMQVYGEGRPIWFEDGYYPIRERLIAGAEKDPESAFIVDVGGGGGQDQTRLFQKFGAELPGKLVVQDQPQVIEGMTNKIAAPEIVKMPHDFMTEQPVKGARAYYMHSIIHDWPDEDAQQILKSIVPAMKPGYSKILICDCVMEDKGAHWLQTTLDIMMMNALAARERTKSEFRALAESCGLKVTGIYKHLSSIDSIVELELA